MRLPGPRSTLFGLAARDSSFEPRGASAALTAYFISRKQCKGGTSTRAGYDIMSRFVQVRLPQRAAKLMEVRARALRYPQQQIVPTPVVNIEDLRKLARAYLPKAVFEFVDGGATDEVSLRANREDFGRYRFVPRVNTDVSRRDLSTTILGQPASLPIIIAPTGLAGLVRRKGECLEAQVATRLGIPYCQSQMSASSIEEVSAAAPGAHWLQVYLLKEREINRRIMHRARAAGYRTLVLTVDTKTQGPRERDMRNGFVIPPRITLRNLADALRCWRWTLDVPLGPTVTFANLAGETHSKSDLFTIAEYIKDLYDLSFGWEALEWCKSEWQGPVAVKGILSPEDARLAVQHGADAVIVSNHGGRQLDSTISAIAALPAVVNAVGGRAEVILDGGVRRGIDVVKALCLGARACMVGRPFLYGLAVQGEAGVDKVAEIFRREIDSAMLLLGQSSLGGLVPGLLAHP
ncbi:MAG: alpha-hydroxy-acid oxidizing protein [Betaproteobacteria bacterium]|nr:alpha-hydroxy-acid oxidizing protein [Betaproteobacteria bacterium]